MKIEDIAKLANVSKSAVSFALNGKAGVSEETRNKILKIAQENGYNIKTVAKNDPPLPQSSRLLRFVACTNGNLVTEEYESLPFFMELIRSIEKQITLRGYSMIISSVDMENFADAIQTLEREQPTAGILLLGTNLKLEQVRLLEHHLNNLVVLDTCYETLDLNFVLMNNIQGAYQATRHLIELNHKNIGYVGGTSRLYNFDMRKKGFQQAMSQWELTLKPEYTYAISPTVISSQESFKDQIRQQMDNLPSALFCEADYMAISVIKSLTELGLGVPEDISVIGFDDIFESQVISPELTTIRVKKDKIAALAIEKLMDGTASDQPDRSKTLVDTQLIIRKSCTYRN